MRRRVSPVARGLLVGALGLAACSSDAASPKSSAETSTADTVDVDFATMADGRKIYFPCVGDGSMPVILIAGLGNSSYVWSAVQPFLTEHDDLHVCLYERAGLGPSDPPTGNVDASNAVDDLEDVLDVAGLTDHVVLVGASYGGLVAELFTRQHPERVSGVVLVDAIHPDLDERIEAILSPEMVTERRIELGSGPEAVTYDGLLASDAAVNEAPPFPAIPLIVLRHGVPFESTHDDYPTEEVESLWTELQGDLAAQSPCSDERVATTSSHRIHQDQPRLTATAILDVVGAVETGRCPS